LRVNFNIKHINISKFFKQNRLTLHHWFWCQRSNITQT
jgi:hypothetical protein